jgi:hypothetical protein
MLLLIYFLSFSHKVCQANSTRSFLPRPSHSSSLRISRKQTLLPLNRCVCFLIIMNFCMFIDHIFLSYITQYNSKSSHTVTIYNCLRHSLCSRFFVDEYNHTALSTAHLSPFLICFLHRRLLRRKDPLWPVSSGLLRLNQQTVRLQHMCYRYIQRYVWFEGL